MDFTIKTKLKNTNIQWNSSNALETKSRREDNQIILGKKKGEEQIKVNKTSS
ncbi:hypothetical protein DsansV1_C34g0226601 [Dioscorea sansibarensis]